MTPAELSKAFEDYSVPAEIRQLILKAGFIDDNTEENDRDITVAVSADGNSLQCPALEFIDLLEEGGFHICHVEEAKDFFFGHKFVFTDSSWPALYALKKFSARLKQNGRRSVTKMSFPVFTIHGLDLGVPANPNTVTTMGKLEVPAKVERSPYLRFLFKPNSKYFDVDNLVFVIPIRKDLRGTVQHILTFYPNLEILSIGLDVLDCIPESGDTRGPYAFSRALGSQRRDGWRDDLDKIMGILGNLKFHPNIQQLKVEIIWKDFFRSGRTFDVATPNQAEIQALEDSFLAVLQQRLSKAKGVTQRHLWC